MSERAFAPIYEISSENKIAGRRPIKVVLHEISLITLVGRKTESRGKRNMFKLTSTPLSECRL